MKPTQQQLGRINEPWPERGLEEVGQCPVCDSEEKEMLHEGLRDRVFFCAPGKWTMYLCKSCHSAYLNPRPTDKTIYLAYEQYFTHQPLPDFNDLSVFGKLQRKLANGYRNWRFGTTDSPASRLGILAAIMMPGVRSNIDAVMRHLPKPQLGQRLLDVGCGNGAFLLRARSAGWDVMGLDFDAKAADVAKQRGLDVKVGGVDSLKHVNDAFDIITLAHVIEHVHEPIHLLRDCLRLLKPGGCLWIETPNINAYGHMIYGENWLHLDPPRHLVLFNRESLHKALYKVGFRLVEDQPYRPLCVRNFIASEAIAEGRIPWDKKKLSIRSWLISQKVEYKARKNVSFREYITVKAIKCV